MRVAIAPDKFKGSLTALEAAAAMARGVARAAPQASIDQVPMADGGEGTAQALVAATGGSFREAQVTGPLGEPVIACFGLLGDGRTAVLEMAAASGLVLVPPARRNPLVTTTRGTGELLLAAIAAGASRVVIGIGGSATNDGGAGFGQAIGFRLLDEQGRDLERRRWQPESSGPHRTALASDYARPCRNRRGLRRRQHPLRSPGSFGGLWTAKGGHTGDG